MFFLPIARRLVVFAFLLTLSLSAHAQFVTIWQTDKGDPGSSQIAIYRGSTAFYNLSWVEVGNPSHSGSEFNINQIAHTIDFGTPGTYQVSITGGFTDISMAGSPAAQKLLSIEQWGLIAWTTFNNAFATCSNLVINAPDNPNLTACASLHQMFQADTLLTTGVKNWGVSHITDFSGMFSACTAFNDDLSGWNMSNATNLATMFAGATAFNSDISAWDVNSVTNMQSVFAGSAFNQNINSWDVSNVTRMTAAFFNATAFNQSLDNWDLSSVTDIDQMFSGATAFNQDIGGWDVSHANVFADMFNNAQAFNQDIGGWNMSGNVYSPGMFENATSFNQDISGWDMSNNTDMSRMFNGAKAFNQNVGAWNVSNTTAMWATFQNATSFNQDLSSWNTTNCTYMGNTFTGALAFNHDVSGWDVSNVNNMYQMFYNAKSFNQDLATWNIKVVADMTNMFDSTALSNDNYDNILIAWAALPTISGDVTFGASTNFYCTGTAAHAALIALNWNITDLGSGCPPTITSFTPTSGKTGTVVTITGTNFQTTTNVSFGGVDAQTYNVNSPTSINATVASGSTGSVSVQTQVGTTTLAGFTFIPAPAISLFAPTSAFAGQTVTITGTGLTGATSVTFGGTAAAFTVVSDTEITAVIGSGANGDVSVTTPGGTAASAGFVYTGAPSISSFIPASASTAATVKIFGSDLGGTTAVSFGGTAATSFNIVSNTEIDAVVAAGTSGDVSITTPAGTTTSPGFTWIAPPIITSFTPTSGTVGTVVTISGVRFTGTASVWFGGIQASSFTVDSDTEITAVVGGGATGDVSVTAPGGSYPLAGFTYLTTPPKIVARDSDNDSGTEVNGTVDMGSTIVDAPLSRIFSIDNLSSAPTTVTSISVLEPFIVVDQPTTISANSFATLTLSLTSPTPGTFSTVVEIKTSTVDYNFTVSATVEPADIVVYNAVTPNGDGAHDFFKIKNIERYGSNRVVILDRLGNEVFRVDDYNNSDPTKRFEGISTSGNGKSLTDGTYYYVIDVKTDKKYTGFLLLQR